MNNIIDTMLDLSGVVKVNESMPFEQLIPFISDGIDSHLRYYAGDALVNLVTEATTPISDKVKALQPLFRKVVGPMAMALATPELSLRIGDSGITVQKSDKLSPASDAKISAYMRGSIERSFKAVDTLINYLEAHVADYPEWSDSPQCSLLQDGYIRSARQYQEEGLIDINRSPVIFQTLIPIIGRVSRDVRKFVDATLEARIRAGVDLSDTDKELKQLIILYIASSVASIYSSALVPATANPFDYRPAIIPLSTSGTDATSYFNTESVKAKTEILEYVQTNAVALGLTAPVVSEEYNKKENHIFSAVL